MPKLCEHTPVLLAVQLHSQMLQLYGFANMCACIAPGILSHMTYGAQLQLQNSMAAAMQGADV